jgi:hypothetical protein
MAPLKRRSRDFLLLKTFTLVVICLTFGGILSCNYSGTSSTAGSGGTSGTGTGYKIDIQVGTSTLGPRETTTVVATVKDGIGSPVPKGTNGCMTAVKNCFVSGDKCFATICNTSTNDLGQFIQTYSASIASGVDTIEVTSQGVIATRTITVTN